MALKYCRWWLVVAAFGALAAPAQADPLFGSWNDFRRLAGVNRPAALTPGPDGRIWFTAPGTSSVGAIGTAGAATAYPVDTTTGTPAYGLGASAVFPNSDGTIWILDARARLGLWTLADRRLLRRSKLLDTPDDDAFPAWRTPDGSIWSFDDDQLGQMRPDGRVTRSRPLGRDGDFDTAAVGDDGRLWLYGTRRGLQRRLVRVDGSGRAEVTEVGEDRYEGPTSTWGAAGVVAGGRLWYPAAREFKGGSEGVLIGVAGGQPPAQVRLGEVSEEESWFGGSITVGPGPRGSIVFTDRGRGTVGLVEAGVARPLAQLGADAEPVQSQTGADGRIWISLARGRLAAVDAVGTVTLYADGIPRDPTPPRVSSTLRGGSLTALLNGGLRARMRCDRPCAAEAHIVVDRRTARRMGVLHSDSLQVVPVPRRWVPLASATLTRPWKGAASARLKLVRVDRAVRRNLARLGSLRARLVTSAFDEGLDLARSERRVTLRR